MLLLLVHRPPIYERKSTVTKKTYCGLADVRCLRTFLDTVSSRCCIVDLSKYFPYHVFQTKLTAISPHPDVPRGVGAEHHELVAGAPRHAARGRHDGVPEDRAGPRDVRRQLLRDPEQEEH